VSQLYIKSAIYGFVLGSILFAVAPLGLGIGIIETLQPVLVPGVMVMKLFVESDIGPATMVMAVVLNGLLFMIPFLLYFIARSKTNP
jgi:hypothetical protein